jgi:GTP-binding protein
LAALPDPGDDEMVAVDGHQIPRVAIVGKPNVGKSSLLNKLAGMQRAVVSDVAGTTIDPIDEFALIDGQPYQLVDTAGIRKRVNQASGSEFYAWLRTQSAIERSDICVVVIDASEPVTEQDLKILSPVEDAGRGLVLAFNKWDLTDEERRRYLDREIERDLKTWAWAPVVNISALTGRGVERVGRAVETSLDGWTTRVTTGQLNTFVARIVAAHPHPVRSGKQPRILFATQAHACPPMFVLFTTGPLDPQYRRFVERRLREEFGFAGSPVKVEVRARAKRSKQ